MLVPVLGLHLDVAHYSLPTAGHPLLHKRGIVSDAPSHKISHLAKKTLSLQEWKEGVSKALLSWNKSIQPLLNEWEKTDVAHVLQELQKEVKEAPSEKALRKTLVATCEKVKRELVLTNEKALRKVEDLFTLSRKNVLIKI